MIEKINFDFTKKEDRKKFEKLPKEEQSEISDEEQKEASLINEVVGEKGSKEDYEIITKLAEEEIASKKEIEKLKEKYNQRLSDILNSQLTVENIETFADNALTQTTDLIDDVLSQSQKYQNNIEPAVSDNAERENQALKFFELPNIPKILQSIIEVKEKIDNIKAYIRTNMADIDEVITPPDNNRKINSRDGRGMEQRRMFPRILTLLYILEHDFEILPNDVLITKGIVTPNMVRQAPYVRAEIQELNRVAYLCDEEGNVSYIFDAAKIEKQNIILNELDFYSKEDKNFLISSCPGIGVRIRQTNQWRNNITFALKEQISEINLENIRPVSEFRKERLSFEDFQQEARSCYDGKGNIAKWYKQEYKNHNNWPFKPHKIYKDKGWEGLPELIGKENRLKKEWLHFDDWQTEVRNLYPGKVNIQKWYYQEYKKHPTWPCSPRKAYKDKGWEGWPELVEKENRLKKECLHFDDWQTEVRNLYPGEVGVHRWYKQEYKNHNNWPSNPNRTYKDKGWEGWSKFVGKDNRFRILQNKK